MACCCRARTAEWLYALPPRRRAAAACCAKARPLMIPIRTKTVGHPKNVPGARMSFLPRLRHCDMRRQSIRNAALYARRKERCAERPLCWHRQDYNVFNGREYLRKSLCAYRCTHFDTAVREPLKAWTENWVPAGKPEIFVVVAEAPRLLSKMR